MKHAPQADYSPVWACPLSDPQTMAPRTSPRRSVGDPVTLGAYFPTPSGIGTGDVTSGTPHDFSALPLDRGVAVCHDSCMTKQHKSAGATVVCIQCSVRVAESAACWFMADPVCEGCFLAVAPEAQVPMQCPDCEERFDSLSREWVEGEGTCITCYHVRRVD